MELNNSIADEQINRRSHQYSLSLILESRIIKKKDTFAIFIDFLKAYDRINITLLWYKLTKLCINGKMLNSLQSLYEQVTCSVRINGTHSEWFNGKTGLKQGCILSPQLFNMFANDLISI